MAIAGTSYFCGRGSYAGSRYTHLDRCALGVFALQTVQPVIYLSGGNVYFTLLESSVSDTGRTAPSITPSVYLRLNGVAILGLALVAYGKVDGSWWVFAVLLLAPDVSMIGYAFGVRVGALIYNTAHTLIGPAILIVLVMLLTASGDVGPAAPLALRLGLIWMAHIGMDRALGYGYKYESGFRETDLGRL